MAQQEAKADSKERETPIAYELAKRQKEISVAEFFTKNRHLLGFDNKRKALLMAVKEAVDNSLDACEEARVLPEISVEMIQLSEFKFRVIIEDNGPGIIKKQIPNIFAKLLYGSKFHTLKQSLTADEPIIVCDKNKIDILPIGEFVDKIAGQDEVRNVSASNISVPVFDKETGMYSWQKISHVIRHKRQNEILKIKMNTGRTIKVTGCHSLFSFNEKTNKIEEVEARSLKPGNFIVAPKILPAPGEINEINILDYIRLKDIENLWIYVYNLDKKFIKDLFLKAGIIHKKISKRRKFYRFCKLDGNFIDILDDSFKQYASKGFLPLKLVLELGLQNNVKNGILQTYYHGNPSKVPVSWQITTSLMRFLGLYVAEGHSDSRQVGFTFGLHEEKYVDEISQTSRLLGLNTTIEKRNRSYRVKVFGGILAILLKNLCNKGAHNKKIPNFVFMLPKVMRQTFLDALYQGDGHLVKNRNCLMYSTISRKLANEMLYLWLMQGVIATIREKQGKGLGKKPSKVYVINIYGRDILASEIFKPSRQLRWKHSYRDLFLETGEKSKLILQQQHLCLLKIKEIEIIDEGYDYVYDLSVPNYENFVGGLGGIACHNSRGQQGIGISAAVLYGQLTTGRSARITSRVSKNESSNYFELNIDTQTNKPVIAKEETVEWPKDHGTKVEIDLEAEYIKGNQSVDEYLKQTAVINPHVTLIYTNPKSEQVIYARAPDKLPEEPKEIKPHPYGVELGMLMDKLRFTESRTLQSFLTSEFSRVGPGTAKEICEHASILPNTKPEQVSRDMAEKLIQGIQKTKIIAPPTDCLSQIGEELLEKGLRKEIKAEFYCAVSRPPSVYRGNPFILEAGVAYGGDIPKDEKANILRFANRVPLLYQEGACAMTKSILETNWKPYGLQQSGESIPYGPVVILVHMASVWVPFTSESKEAIAHYEEIKKEIKLALQECGRLLGSYVRKKVRVSDQLERANMFERYIPEVADSLSVLTGEKKEKILEGLKKMLVKPEINKEIVEADDSDDQLYRMEFKKENEELGKNSE